MNADLERAVLAAWKARQAAYGFPADMSPRPGTVGYDALTAMVVAALRELEKPSRAMVDAAIVCDSPACVITRALGSITAGVMIGAHP